MVEFIRCRTELKYTIAIRCDSDLINQEASAQAVMSPILAPVLHCEHKAW